jgi:hypothetical protein
MLDPNGHTGLEACRLALRVEAQDPRNDNGSPLIAEGAVYLPGKKPTG